jgi:hypothetical protein
MKARSFYTAVLFPWSIILVIVLLLGCEPPKQRTQPKAVPAPMAPMPKTCPCDPSKPCTPKATMKIVAYGATWCQYCRANEKNLSDLEQRGIVVERIDIDTQPRSDISSVPVYFVSCTGRETVRTQKISDVEKLANDFLNSRQ